MNLIDYFWPRALCQITGIVFLSQLIIEVTGIATRKPEYDWVIYACGAAFLASLIFAVAVVFINALRVWRNEKE